ncbi:glycosyltransferase family 39 protein [Thermoflexus sp.]|uniref:glycosyltransferase family 39 protein n=1 Tax=Thermoflexus sp. TaxID=1969742 RepID=UPI0025D592DB|nr:glycosyltransferase family 39 protein [Thermoflexus sp.]MDW8064050.1 glycosyltransferase family 39 protein [Anaerolineae bacterium]MCS6964104.1 glycosyltransferase family 39 protein [Thermoflexus sp.]MCS7349990.1 glycosyltransferase family 39 protein [Thermoflexus sp.]MCX7690160.1 glycosyltransferase family 39 protein [Thermoflexus sp.]MDW8179438.1 glycosyltransferase family 39 protein [Anaerolineae bacterium]
MKRGLWTALSLILLGLAFGLRVYRLGAASFWYDEAFSIDLARNQVWQPLEAHPPLFYLALRLWMTLTGPSEFAARFLSALAGTLTVALFAAAVARIGRSPIARTVALGLAATLPFWIWESRETRMYAMLGLWTALVLYGVVRDAPRLILFAALAGIYTHYAMLWMVPGILILGLRHGPSRIPWAAALLAGAIPGALHALWVGSTQGAFWPGTLDLGRILMTLWQAQGLQARMAGFVPPDGSPWIPGLIAGAGVAGTGLALGLRRRTARSMFLAMSLLPLMVGLGLLYRSPKFHPHYFIGAAAGFWLPIALGWADAVRRARGAFLPALAAWGLFVLPALNWTLVHAEQVKDDWRSAVRTVEARKGSEEAVVLVSGFALPAYRVYARATTPIPLPADPVVDVRHVLDYEAAAPVLNRALVGTRGAWLVQWGDEINDPAQVVAAALDWIGDEIETFAFAGGLRVRHFVWGEFHPLPEEPEALFGHPGQPIGPNLIWLGYGLPGGTLSADRPLSVIAGWRTTGPLPAGLRVSLRLEREDGTLWGQWDGALGGETWDTARWPWPRVILARYGVEAQVGTPPGRYRPRLVVYQGDSVWLAAQLNPVDLAPPQKPYQDPRWEKSPRAQWPGLALTHVDLEGEPRACQPLTLALWWRVDGTPASNQVRLRVGEARITEPWNLAQPDRAWGPGEQWRTRHSLRMPCAPGRYALEVALGGEEDSWGMWQTAATVEVRP